MGKRLILVVDDDASMREMLRLVLEEAGYEVATEVDGRAATRALAGRRFDLVITDLIMPEKDGTELILELRRHHPATMIIAMSGGGLMGRTEYLKIARMFGAHATLEKPFSRDELLATLSKLLPDP